MTRRDNRAISVRVNRIERLESRHMLSADGLSFTDFHDEFANELARTSHSVQALRGSEFDLRRSERNWIEQRHGNRMFHHHQDDLNDRNFNQVRAGLETGRRERIDRHFGREGRHIDTRTIPPIVDTTIADGELAINNNVRLKLRPVARTVPVTTQLPISSSRITFVIVVPSAPSSVSLDLRPSRLSTVTPIGARAVPQTAAADSSTAVSPIADSQQSRNPEQELTTAEQAAFVQAEAVQLVSVHPHNDFHSTATAIDVAPEDPSTNAGGSSRFDFRFDAFRFEDESLDEFLEQSKSLEENFAELGELLDAIALERTESMLDRESAAPPMIPAEQFPAEQFPAGQHTETIADSRSESLSHGMILLLPGPSSANPTVQLAAQVFDSPDDSAIGQWTVGVGFFQALEIVGDTRFAAALVASETSVIPVNNSAQNDVANAFAWQSDSVPSSRQAAGLVFCCLGIQYLRKRRKDTSELVMHSSNSRNQATLD